MCVYGASVTLPVLLLLGGARAQCEGGPHLMAAGPTVRNCGAYCADYGQNIELYCTSRDSTTLGIRRRQRSTQLPKDLPTLVVNATTILSLIKPTIGHYTYLCSDSESDCERSLFIDHKPAVDVSAPRVSFQVDGFGYHYFLTLGEDFNITCTGSRYKTLDIYNSSSKLNTGIVNGTSVTYRARADQTGKFKYECRAQNDAFQRISIMVYFPETFNFSCISYDSGENIKLSWKPAILLTTIKLVYRDMLLPCVEDTSEGSSCVWDNMFFGRRIVGYDDKNITLTIQACLHNFCNEQTFTFTFESIMKYKPVRAILVLHTSSKESLITWLVDDKNSVYKVEYRRTAVGDSQWVQANKSSVRCDEGHCQYRLALLSPDSTYEARVYNRHAEATDERAWSEPTPVFIFTKPILNLSKSETKDPSEPYLNALYDLGEYIIKKSKALRKFIMKLKLKREKYHRKIEIIKRINSLESELYWV